MTDFKVGLFIFKLDHFGSPEGALNAYKSGKVRRPQREVCSAYCGSVQRFEFDRKGWMLTARYNGIAVSTSILGIVSFRGSVFVQKVLHCQPCQGKSEDAGDRR